MAKIPCSICSEKGTVSQGRACPVCSGTGEIDAPEGFHMSEAHQISMFRMLVDTTDKLDSIIAEQASQREDLTAALSQIWNKVKDL